MRKDFKVGARAVSLEERRGTRAIGAERWERKTWTVVAVGRKYVTAVQEGAPSWSVGDKFSDDGCEGLSYVRSYSPGYGIGHVMLFPSEAAADEYVERRDIKDWLYEAVHKSAFSIGILDRLPIENLRAARAALDPACMDGNGGVGCAAGA